MNNKLLLDLYHISGWLINLATLLLAYFAFKSKAIWKGKYKFMAFFFVVMALVELYASITVFTTTSNLYIDYWYLPIIFSLRILYLSKQTQLRFAEQIGIIVIVAFIVFQIYVGLHSDLKTDLNVWGENVEVFLLICASLFNLTILFKEKSISKKLRQNPDFWFTITILMLGLKAIFEIPLDNSAYISQNLTALLIFRLVSNFTKIFFFYGYYKGIKLLG